ncbi:uncharacterized protein FPRO_14792 [Fusarium proliferatum ET1]|uniref:Uncharacterized protein n=1 Tax=Fusarium proliferatum (strain ET1) TaxID=1227346 RepID=A0A1L7WAU0_FUSPR|nr:uncharacterized protein FPRO_14792 [Fusarium proliferatum ET1]CZR49731.1 uncharacterized protein FPRO_14792 [Fusarium proliferatum ET1]
MRNFTMPLDDRITPDNVRQHFQDRGFFFQEIEDVGAIVKEAYDCKRIKSVVFQRFNDSLHSNPLLAKLLEDHCENSKVTWAWGKCYGFYAWDNLSSPQKDSIILYMLAPQSHAFCAVGSHRDKKEIKSAYGNGALELKDEVLASYDKEDVKTELGGVLCISPSLGHKMLDGYSKMFTMTRK